jgi:hypothetical protein
MRKAKLINTAATAANQTSAFWVGNNETVTVTAVPLLQSAEKGTLQITNDDGTTWINALNGDTPESNELSATTTVVYAKGPGNYRIDKDVSTAAVGIYIQESFSK